MHAYTHACLATYIHIYIHKYMHMYVHTYMHGDLCMSNTDIQTNACIHTYIHTYIILLTHFCLETYIILELSFIQFLDLHIFSILVFPKFHFFGNMEIWKYRNSADLVDTVSIIEKYLLLFSILIRFIHISLLYNSTVVTAKILGQNSAG